MRETIRFNKKLNHLHYFDPLFFQNFVFLISPFSEKEYSHVCKWIGCDIAPKGGKAGSTLFSQCSEKIAIVIWDNSPSVIMHEIIHAALSTFRKIGDKTICFENEEAFAYYCQRLCSVVYTYHPSTVRCI